MRRESGVVREFSNAEGYGHIESDAAGDLVFVHFSQIKADGFRTLERRQRVEFTRVEMPDGPHAWDVLKLDGTTSYGA